MKTTKIFWNDKNFDIGYDQQPVQVDEQLGNKGVGTIVFVLCSLAIIVPSSITLSQIYAGTATGNPVGAIITVILLLGWPTCWGFSQFFKRRLYLIKNGVVKFKLISFLTRKTASIKLSEYGMIQIGRIPSRARIGVAIGGDIGYTGVYFVRLKHENSKYTIDLYNRVSNQMDHHRLERYSRLFHLPVKDVTPAQTAKETKFRKRLESFLEQRRK